jgi:hypothetical protein
MTSTFAAAPASPAESTSGYEALTSRYVSPATAEVGPSSSSTGVAGRAEALVWLAASRQHANYTDVDALLPAMGTGTFPIRSYWI